MRTLKFSGLAALTVAVGLAGCSKTTYETPAPSASTGTTVTTTTTARADTTARRDTTMGYSASGTAGQTAAGTAGSTSTTVTTTTAPNGAMSGSGTMSNSGAMSGSAAMASGSARTFALMPVNNSGFTGNVTFTDLGNKTRVAMTLNSPANTSSSADHNAMIHTGTCAAPGPKVADLHDVEGNGKAASSELDLMASQIMNGQHIVVAHENPGDRVVACVAIPSK
ncbi:MAG: hypothetical protein ABI637_09515 [Gemmatimonadota bacterium]